jgi:hypothetical protein
MQRDWWAPLTGVGFVVLLILSFIIAGEPPDADDGAQKVVEFYVDNKDEVQLGVAISAIAALLLVYFGAILRKALAESEGARGGVLPNVAFAGTVMMALGAMVDGTLMFAMAEAGKDVDPVALQAMQAIWDNDFFPIALGIVCLLSATGLSVVRYGGLPKWLGWVAIALAIVGVTPIGFVAFMGGAVWLLVVSIVLTLRRRSGAVEPPAATA